LYLGEQSFRNKAIDNMQKLSSYSYEPFLKKQLEDKLKSTNKRKTPTKGLVISTNTLN
jgi:hypothetical protein